jgi:hypothetical protein
VSEIGIIFFNLREEALMPHGSSDHLSDEAVFGSRSALRISCAAGTSSAPERISTDEFHASASNEP